MPLEDKTSQGCAGMSWEDGPCSWSDRHQGQTLYRVSGPYQGQKQEVTLHEQPGLLMNSQVLNPISVLQLRWPAPGPMLPSPASQRPLPETALKSVLHSSGVSEWESLWAEEDLREFSLSQRCTQGLGQVLGSQQP